MLSLATAASAISTATDLDAIQQRPTLALGDRGSEVVELQRLLLHWAAFSGYTATDDRNLLGGYFDGAVRNAVEKFQAAMFLQPNGVVGALTWQALLTGAPVKMPILSMGSVGIEVMRLQRILVAIADLPFSSAIGGNFDPVTEHAVKRFQQQSGLIVDGVVGEKTWYALSRAFPYCSIAG